MYTPRAEIATGAALLILPGGAYGGLSAHEARGYAEWLCANGITGIVLNYRLGTHGYRHPAMLDDARRGMRVVRANAAQWGLDPSRIGIIGSSAGGHLAATLLTRYDEGDPDAPDEIEHHSCRPDLAVLCYPVITMHEGTHAGSRANLLGDMPSTELLDELSCHQHVRVDTPPCFLWHTWEDTSVPLENSLLFASALRAQGVRFELHLYELGGHGMGLGDLPNLNRTEKHRWIDDCLAWLREHGYAADADAAFK
ncbi:MAG: alpha/beta hydrolase [Puniceicoccales bacterium]